ncbi:MAG: rRNA pseudouridine synthase [Ignavibacteria bacterium]|nr:rRNA pseudouridine synthase [Ignavibacteria bacterium]
MEEREIKNSVRLNRYLAQCGLGSRRKCDALIAAGKILVNNKKVSELGVKIDPSADLVAYNGQKVQEIKRLEYIAYHKSRGILVTAMDPQGRKTIYDELKRRGYDAGHLKYIGRLDRDSEGLLLLTNDGDMVHALTHPRFQIKKVYEVEIDKRLLQTDADTMVTSGVASEGQALHAGAISGIEKKDSRNKYWYQIDLYEGKNRQIRRMFEVLGYTVKKLKRIQFSSIKIGDLARGCYRFLTDREIRSLKGRGYRIKGK